MHWNIKLFYLNSIEYIELLNIASSVLNILSCRISGQSGDNGQRATPLHPIARSLDIAIAPMPPPLLPARATQLRRLHVHQVKRHPKQVESQQKHHQV